VLTRSSRKLNVLILIALIGLIVAASLATALCKWIPRRRLFQPKMHRLGLKISLLGVFFFLGPLLPGCYCGRVTFDANSSVVCGPRPHDFANVKRVSLQSPHAGTEFGGSTMTTPSEGHFRQWQTELVSEEGSSDPLKELLPSTQEPMARRIIPPPASRQGIT